MVDYRHRTPLKTGEQECVGICLFLEDGRPCLLVYCCVALSRLLFLSLSLLVHVRAVYSNCVCGVCFHPRYFNIVREKILDSVPKTIMHFLVNFVKQALQNEVSILLLYREYAVRFGLDSAALCFLVWP